jgi:hypothetical protein
VPLHAAQAGLSALASLLRPASRNAVKAGLKQMPQSHGRTQLYYICLMTKISNPLVVILLSIAASSCSSVDLSVRAGKDKALTKKDFTMLAGKYANLGNDSILFKSLFDHFDHLDHTQRKGISVELASVEERKITINLYDGEQIEKGKTVSGKFKKGYFKVKRQYTTKFIAGPLLWGFGSHRIYIGLSKTDDLVVFNSGGGGVLLLVIFPIFGAEGTKGDYEYSRLN